MQVTKQKLEHWSAEQTIFYSPFFEDILHMVANTFPESYTTKYMISSMIKYKPII